MSLMRASRLKPEDQAKVAGFLAEIVARARLPGIVAAIEVGGQSLVATAGCSEPAGASHMDGDQHFRLGCLNKFLLALVTLALAEEGRLDLDQPLARYLPELAGRLGARIRVRHLLSHSAGYQEENLADPDLLFGLCWPAFAGGFNARRLLFEPGTVFDYKHSASVILARIVETAAGRTAARLIRERLLAPLGIALLDGDQAGSPRCAKACARNPFTGERQVCDSAELSPFWADSVGSAFIRPIDLLKLGAAVAAGPRILSSGCRKRLLAPALKLPGLFPGVGAGQSFFQYGLGCARYPDGSYGVCSTAYGHSLALRFDPRRDIVIVAALNSARPDLRDYTLSKLHGALLPVDAPLVPALCPPPQTAMPLEDLQGIYIGPVDNSYRAELRAGKLLLTPGHNPAIDVDPESAVLRFERDPARGLCLSNPAATLPLGFFRQRGAGPWHLMVGDKAFRHMESAVPA